MIKIKIIKLPPEAYDLAKKIEDTLADMTVSAIKSMVSADSDFENLEITVYESLIKLINNPQDHAT